MTAARQSMTTGTSNGNLLSVEGLNLRFGGILALNNVNFHVRPGSITALIGPNGAGKTTVFNCITGFYRADRGSIYLRGAADASSVNIARLLGESYSLSDVASPSRFASKTYYKMFGGAHLATRAGLARTFQNIRLFREMTVVENLLVAQHHAQVRGIFSGMLALPNYTRARETALEAAYGWLERFSLVPFAERLAGELPYGMQRKLEIARALCTGPRLLCLDEPAAGLNPHETDELADLIVGVRDQCGVTILVIEHDMSLVMGISDEIVVLDHGVVIASGVPQDIRTNPQVLAAYLGTEETAGDISHG